MRLGVVERCVGGSPSGADDALGGLAGTFLGSIVTGRVEQLNVVAKRSAAEAHRLRLVQTWR